MVLVCKEGIFKQRSHNSKLWTVDYRLLHRLKPASCRMQDEYSLTIHSVISVILLLAFVSKLQLILCVLESSAKLTSGLDQVGVLLCNPYYWF